MLKIVLLDFLALNSKRKISAKYSKKWSREILWRFKSFFLDLGQLRISFLIFCSSANLWL